MHGVLQYHNLKESYYMDDIFEHTIYDNGDAAVEFIDESLAEELAVEEEPVLLAELPAVAPKKTNFLNNKDILKEIHRSKCSFSEFTEERYSTYDVIVGSLADIFEEDTQQRAKAAQAARLSQQLYDAAVVQARESGDTLAKPRPMDYKVDPGTIPCKDLVFRVVTYEHIPLAPGRKKTPRSTADRYVKLNFCPFKHYIIENNVAVEVGRSHSKDGEFCITHGRLTNTLGKMFKLLVDKYAQRSNWRGYSYLDEMKGHALLQLSQWALQFDESRSDNPFAYYTASMSTGFTRVLNLEKRNQDIRDDLLIASGASPSFSRQLALEEEIRKLREDALSG
jgi:hypothetical protein